LAKRNKKKKIKAAAIQFGGAFKQVLMAATTHPVTAGLAVMTMTVITKQLVTQGKEDTEWRRRFNGEMSGLYDGAQKLAAAAALAPVVTGALGVAKSGIEAYTQRPVDVELGYP